MRPTYIRRVRGLGATLDVAAYYADPANYPAKLGLNMSNPQDYNTWETVYLPQLQAMSAKQAAYYQTAPQAIQNQLIAGILASGNAPSPQPSPSPAPVQASPQPNVIDIITRRQSLATSPASGAPVAASQPVQTAQPAGASQPTDTNSTQTGTDFFSQTLFGIPVWLLGVAAIGGVLLFSGGSHGR